MWERFRRHPNNAAATAPVVKPATAPARKAATAPAVAPIVVNSGDTMSRRDFLIGAGTGVVGLGALYVANQAGLFKQAGDWLHNNTGVDAEPSATATAGATATPTATPELNPSPTPDATGTPIPTHYEGATGPEGKVIAKAIPVPNVVSGDMVRGLVSTTITHGPKDQPFTYPQYQEGTWFLPLYDQGQVNWDYTDQSGHHHDANWRGIGPWYPEAFQSIDSGAAHLKTHNAVGETVIVADNGGKVEFAIWQLAKYQTQGADNPNQTMQYTFKGLEAFQEVAVIDPDTGAVLLGKDGLPLVYKTSKFGDFVVGIPATDSAHDVRVGFVFDFGASPEGVQKHEIKVERGPNDHPELTGENPLPDSVIKPTVPVNG